MSLRPNILAAGGTGAGAAGRRGLLRAAAALTALGSRGARALDVPGISLAVRAMDTVPPGYARDVLVRWGDRVTYDARPWTPRSPTADAAESQFGWDGRLVGLLVQPVGADGIPRGVLAVAHPTVDPAMAFPGRQDRPELAAAMQGVSLLNLERQHDRWTVVDGGYQARRLTANTLCRVAGPLAPALGGSVRGLLAVSGGCWTPWGTLLLAEDDPGAWSRRLRGLDPRFAEPRGFGWIAEMDGVEPGSVPAKRTALGRFAHSDAAAAMTRDGRAVVYMTDRRQGGFLLRFTSSGPARGPDALDEGVLAAAIADGGRLHWVNLPGEETSLTDTAAVAGRAGATGFAFPAGMDVDERSGALYVACRGDPGAAPASLGYVLRVQPDGRDHGSDTALLSLFVQGDRPARAGMPWPEHADTVAADGFGRVWIGTDRGGRVGAMPDMLFGCETAGPDQGVPRPIYGAPRGAAMGGAAVTPEGEALLVVVRTPGAEPGASWDRPGSSWPASDGFTPPRTALVGLSRLRGGRIGG